ncbi:MAG: hypothetical protein J6Y71_00945 [Ruminococcus sp.]|nr:hypothetical protein [Ruminococcus sp.]
MVADEARKRECGTVQRNASDMFLLYTDFGFERIIISCSRSCKMKSFFVIEEAFHF